MPNYSYLSPIPAWSAESPFRITRFQGHRHTRSSFSKGDLHAHRSPGLHDFHAADGRDAVHPDPTWRHKRGSVSQGIILRLVSRSERRLPAQVRLARFTSSPESHNENQIYPQQLEWGGATWKPSLIRVVGYNLEGVGDSKDNLIWRRGEMGCGGEDEKCFKCDESAVHMCWLHSTASANTCMTELTTIFRCC